MKKIIKYEALEKSSFLWKDKKTVLVGGCFDIFHFGHFTFLKKAKTYGNFLIIALESDEFIKRKKNKIAIHNQNKRAQILSHIDFVDAIILLPFFDKDRDYLELVLKIKPKIIAVSQNDPQMNNKNKEIKAVGGQIKMVTPMIKKFSGSKIYNYAPISSN